MTLKIESVPDCSNEERELDEELQAVHDLIMEAIMAALWIETSMRDGVDEVNVHLADVREHLSRIRSRWRTCPTWRRGSSTPRSLFTTPRPHRRQHD